MIGDLSCNTEEYLAYIHKFGVNPRTEELWDEEADGHTGRSIYEIENIAGDESVPEFLDAIVDEDYYDQLIDELDQKILAEEQVAM